MSVDLPARLNPLRPLNITTNTTLLDAFAKWNYTLSPTNGTLSNGSNCILAFYPYFNDSALTISSENGTILSAAACDSPILAIGPRAGVSIAFAVLCIATIPLTFINLRKHGLALLPRTKRISQIGRRVQYYWLFLTAVTGGIAGFFGIDVDRDYQQGVALAVHGIFWAANGACLLASQWECVRNYGAHAEHVVRERNPSLTDHEIQQRFHGWFAYYAPIPFYLFALLYFLISAFSPWGAIMDLDAAAATSSSRKAAAVFGLVAWAWTLIWASIVAHTYPSMVNLRLPTICLVVSLLMLLIRQVYIIVATCIYSASTYIPSTVALPYFGVFGMLTTLLAICAIEVMGWRTENEDKDIIRAQKEVERERNEEVAALRKEKAKR